MTRSICGIESRHPLRGFVIARTTIYGFADSPVALCRHPLRGFVIARATVSQVLLAIG
ncbi:MAG TPA: hypothetical protein VN743_03155 [Blastocatellia bacterium]|nr:hypothetical protein [Blastocatellia bacterium]